MLQANLQRKKLAINELLIEGGKRRAAIALLQEPYTDNTDTMRSRKGARLFQDTGMNGERVKAVIAIFDDTINVIQYPQFTTNNIVVVKIQTSAWEIALASFYFEPDKPIEPYLEQLEKIFKEISAKNWIIGGDANAKSPWWGSPIVEYRGEVMLGTLDELNLHLLNRGEIPTFDTIRGGKRYSSHVDISACSANILDLVENWRVDEDLTSADHNGMAFSIRLQKSQGVKINRTTRKYNTKKANWTTFDTELQKLLQENNITKLEIENINEVQQLETITNKLTKCIEDSCLKSMPIKKAKEILAVPWWSETLTKLKKEVSTKKRRIRCAAPARKPRVIEEYLKQKEEYELEAARAQVESWKEFCCKQDKEGVWEGIYRVISRTTRREEDLPLKHNGAIMDAKNSAKLLADTFYPEDLTSDDNIYHRRIRSEAEKVNDGEQDECCDPPFTMAELKSSSESFNPKKAPGADGFTADICSRAIHCEPELFLALYNKCLSYGHFPTVWKKATVIILKKPNREDYTIPKSYRPIGLLSILGKTFEKMLVARLKFHLLPRMSTRQYGFMPQKSTEDSLYNLMQYIGEKLNQKSMVTIVSLDIEGAFDSAWWPILRVRLAEERCPLNLRRVIDSYLRDRMVAVRYAGEEHLKNTSKGCVQGSIGGPILWNLLLDPLLKELENRGTYCQAFADDIVLVFDGQTAEEIQGSANVALEHVRAWGVDNKLKFAPHKTTAMLITRKLKYDTPRLNMGGIDIGMSRKMKLLGVTIDDKLTFNTHVSNVCKKAIGIYKQLSKAAKVSWGLHPEVIRTIYVATIEPVILYAASVWAPAAEKIGTQNQLSAVQRGIAQKICKAYRTVSLNSALLLAGLLPLDLRVREAASLYEAKKGVPQEVLGDREVERVEPAIQAPHPAEYISPEFCCLVNQDEVEQYKELDVHIFTDGSKIEGKVGAALSLWSGDSEKKAFKLALPNYCTVYQAELLAIYKATTVILGHNASTFGIYSDSMAALQTIQNLKCFHPLAVRIRENLKTMSLQNKVVKLFWIKAHAGLVGNERADELAKEAAIKSKKKPEYDLCPISFVKRCVRMETLDEWNRRYVTGETGSITKLFFPNAVTAHRIVKKMEASSITTQIMTGHGGFSEYLHRFKCKENPSCICDNITHETIPHILFECPTFALERFNIEQQIGNKIESGTVSEIMLNTEMREKFMNYCIKIVKKVILRNKTRL